MNPILQVLFSVWFLGFAIWTMVRLYSWDKEQDNFWFMIRMNLVWPIWMPNLIREFKK